MSSKVIKDNSRGKMYDVSYHRMPHSSKKRIRHHSIEIDDLQYNINFGGIGLFSAIFVGLYLPMPIEWKIGLAFLYFLSSIHISKGEK